MSHPSQLPPRSPLMNNQLMRHGSLDSTSQSSHWGYNFDGQHQMFPFHNPIVQDKQPSWYDNLLTDPENRPKGLSLRRASSDPVTLLNMAASYNGTMLPVSEGEEELASVGSVEGSKKNENASDSGYELAADNCVYGPNSPRHMDKPANSESSIVSGLLESFSCNPLQYVTADGSNALKGSDSNGRAHIYTNSDDTNPANISKRRSGQRSRVRKIQYISELERTVEMLQTLSADLAARVAALFHNRVALSAENNKIRQQISSLRHEKVIKEDEYQSLKKEADRLRGVPVGHRRSKSTVAFSDMGSSVIEPSTINWQMLDMSKLNLGGSPIHIKPISRP